MAIDTPRALFLHELGEIQTAETAGGTLLGLLIGSRVQDSALNDLLHQQAEESTQQLKNIESCFKVLRASALTTRSASVDGIRESFQDFTRTLPSREVQDLFALDAAARFVHLTIAAYMSLVDWAVLLGESQCAQMLKANLGQKRESAGRLERLGHDMSERLLAMAGRD